MPELKIRFVTCSDPVSALIRRGEYDFWATHAEVATADGRLIGAHYDGGVQARPGDYDAAIWDKQQFVSIGATADQAIAFGRFLEAQLGKPYDIRAIASLAVSPFAPAAPNWQDPGAWFCSELVAAALLAANVLRPVPTDVWRITPRDLLLMLSTAYPLTTPVETRLPHATANQP